MAIYVGDWLDGEGNPFDPNSVSRTTGNQGNVAQAVAPPDPSAPNRTAFALAAKQSATDYLLHLPDAEFDLLCDWDNFPGSTFRHLFDPLQAMEPWDRFNARLFLDYYYNPVTPPAWPVPSQQYTVAFNLTAASAYSQLATLHVTYDVIGEPDPDNGFVVFQIHPRRVASSAAVRYTRLALDWEWSPGHDHEFDIPVSFQWPLTTEDTFRILVRVKQRWFWMQSSLHQIPVS